MQQNSKDVYKYGVNVREFNEQHWEFIRNLSKEEVEEFGKKGYGYGEYKCRHCKNVVSRKKESFKNNLFVCPNECNGVKHFSTIVLRGVNDIATTHPRLVKYLASESDKHRYSAYSCKKVKMKCPNCEETKERSIEYLRSQGFACDVCSDGVSFPEKFIMNLLKQLNIIYKKEKMFSGSKKRYDFYIPSLNMIIETHGEQHYARGFELLGRRGWQEEQENDKHKREIALANGVKHYVELDCRESNMRWIKNSIVNSDLPKLLSFNEKEIDWTTIEENSLNSSIREVCDYFKENEVSPKEVAEMFELSISTVYKHLKRGTDLGWCDYSSTVREQNKKMPKYNGARPIKAIDIESGEHFIFDSVGQAVVWVLEVTTGKPKRYSKGNSISYHITKCVRSEKKTAYGYTWCYIDQDEQIN